MKPFGNPELDDEILFLPTVLTKNNVRLDRRNAGTDSACMILLPVRS